MSRHKDTSWNKSSHWYHQKVGLGGHHYHQKVILPVVKQLLKVGAKNYIFDFGCGQGVLSREIPDTVPYLGIDLAPNLVKQAKALNKSPQHRFMVADITKPLKLTEKASQIFMVLSLQNMGDIDGVFKNVADYLREDGELIMVLNHPVFRIPRQSGWTINQDNKLQVRWIAKYMSIMEIPITMHPGERQTETTWSYHHSLSDYMAVMKKHHLALTDIKELVSDKESQGKAAKMENRSRSEIPMFMVLVARKLLS